LIKGSFTCELVICRFLGRISGWQRKFPENQLARLALQMCAGHRLGGYGPDVKADQHSHVAMHPLFVHRGKIAAQLRDAIADHLTLRTHGLEVCPAIKSRRSCDCIDGTRPTRFDSIHAERSSSLNRIIGNAPFSARPPKRHTFCYVTQVIAQLGCDRCGFK
jgi:hypothetical protein